MGVDPMSDVQTAQGPSQTGWQVQLVRMTGFLTAGYKIEQVDWWKRLTGVEPENRASQSRLGLIQEQGEWMGGLLVLSVQPARFDWVLSVRDGDIAANIGSFIQVKNEFQALLTPWLKDCPPIQRLAFGGILNLSMP